MSKHALPMTRRSFIKTVAGVAFTVNVIPVGALAADESAQPGAPPAQMGNCGTPVVAQAAQVRPRFLTGLVTPFDQFAGPKVRTDTALATASAWPWARSW